MKNPTIKHAVGREIHKREKRTERTADDIINFLHNILSLDVTQIFDDDGYTTMARIKELPLSVRMCISNLETDHRKIKNPETDEFEDRQYVKIKWMSKDNALELALKHHGLLSPDLHLHVMTDEMKSQLLIELMSHTDGPEEDSNVIDAEYIRKKASEE